MTAGNHFDRSQEPEIFSALLTPHRSLNRTGFVVLMAVLSVISFAAGVVFLMLGAWPVVGFFGLDVLAIYIAFKINFGRARARSRKRPAPERRVHLRPWRLGIRSSRGRAGGHRLSARLSAGTRN